MNEIYGEENFVAQMVWEGANKNDARQIGIVHEYVLVYAKNRISTEHDWSTKKDGIEPVLIEIARLKKQYGNDYESASVDLANWFKSMKATPSFGLRRFHKIDDNGAYKEDDPTAPGGRHFDLINPHTGCVIPLRPKRGWSFDQETFNQMVANNRVVFVSDKSVMIKRYLHETDTITPPSVIYQPARSASERLEKLMGSKCFEFPKDETVIAKFVEMCTCCGDLILDFFAGSGTTAHAVMELNREDGGNRKFILVQLPELCDESSEAFKAGYKTIADISRERIRRVIRKYVETDDYPSLQGFRSYLLAPSNFKVWRNEEITEENIETQLEMFIDPVKPESETENILVELMLKSGFQLTDKVENKGDFYCANGNELILALTAITPAIAAAIIALHPQKAVALDRLFNNDDELKTNTALQMRDAGVEFRTI